MVHSNIASADTVLNALEENRDRRKTKRAQKALNLPPTMADSLMEDHINEKAEKIQGVVRKHQARKKLATLKQEANDKQTKAQTIQGAVRQRQARKKLETLKSQPINYISDPNKVDEEAEKNKQLKKVVKTLRHNKGKKQYQRARKVAGLGPDSSYRKPVDDSWIEQMIEGEGPHLDSLSKAVKTPQLASDYKPPARAKDDSEIRPPSPPSPGKVLSANLERAKAIYADIVQGEPISTHLAELQKISPRKITANAGAKRVSEVIRDLELEASIEDISKRKGKRGKTSESRDAESIEPAQLGRASKLPIRVDTSLPKAPGKLELSSPLGKRLQSSHRASAGAP